MNRDSKPLVLTAVVPAWAQERQIAPLRALKSSRCYDPSAISASPKLPLLRVDEAAALLRVSTKTIRRLVGREDLRAVRIGRSVRIHSSEIDRLIAAGCPNGHDFEDGGGRA